MSRPAMIDPFDILAHQQAGHTAQETATMLGIDRSWVYKLARQIGAPPFMAPHNPRRTPDEIRRRVHQLAADGVPQKRIAAEVGRSASWVSQVLRGKR